MEDNSPLAQLAEESLFSSELINQDAQLLPLAEGGGHDAFQPVLPPLTTPLPNSQNPNEDNATEPSELPVQKTAEQKKDKCVQSEGEESKENQNFRKLILQGIMSAGYLDAKGVKNLFTGACAYLNVSNEERAKRIKMQYIQQLVRGINERLKAFDMAIKSGCCEFTGKKYYFFLVTVEKPIMKFQSLFTKSELKLFMRIMDLCMTKYRNFSVPLTECINLASKVDSRTLSKVAAEDFIEKMLNFKYFTKMVKDVTNEDQPEDSYDITLAIRTIKEFEAILRNDYGKITGNCVLCKTIMIHGNECPGCKVGVHKACYAKYMTTEFKSCPGCEVPWADNKMGKRCNPDGIEKTNTITVEPPAKRRGTKKSPGKTPGASGQPGPSTKSQNKSPSIINIGTEEEPNAEAEGAQQQEVDRPVRPSSIAREGRRKSKSPKTLSEKAQVKKTPKKKSEQKGNKSTAEPTRRTTRNTSNTLLSIKNLALAEQNEKEMQVELQVKEQHEMQVEQLDEMQEVEEVTMVELHGEVEQEEMQEDQFR